MMHISSTEYLELIVKNDCFILLEKAAPAGRLKREIITLTTRDGQPISMRTPSGFNSGQIELPRSIFDDYLAASLIEQDRPEDSEGRLFFRLTKDGRARVAA